MRGIRALAFASVSLVAVSAPAFAQEAAPASEEGYAESPIIVQARRRDESIQDVPAVVNAVTSEAIEQLNLRKFEDITAVVPGLSLVQNANGIGAESVVRGVKFDVNASGNNGTIQFYYNDAPMGGGAILQALFDIGQIEVLRGPQGTLRGRATPSGSINITTRRPNLSEVGGVANATITSINGYNVNGAINVPILADKLAVRLAGVIEDNDGNRVKPSTGALDLENKTKAGRISVAADPFEGVLLLDFNYQTVNNHKVQYNQVQSGSYVNPALVSPEDISAKDRGAVRGLPNVNTQRFKILNWQAQLNLAGQKLTYVGSQLKQHLNSLGPSDLAGIFPQTSAQLFYLNGSVPAIQLGRTVPFAQPTDSRSTDRSHEIRLQNDERIADMFDYVVGYLRTTQTTNTAFEQIIGGLAAPAAPAAPTTLAGVVQLPLIRFGESKEESIFGNLTAHIGDLELSAGARRIWYSTDSGLLAFSVPTATFVENPTVRVTEKTAAWIYAASAKYKFTPDAMVYANFGTSWRPSAVAIGGPTAPSAFQAQFLRTSPEKSKSYEVGVKSEFMDGQLLLNLSAYYQKFTNYPYRAPGAGVFAVDIARGGGVVPPVSNNAVNSFNYLSGVPVTVKGVEGDVTYRPNENFFIGASFSYADGKIKNGVIPCLDVNDDNVPDAGRPTIGDLYGDVGNNFIDTCSVTLRSNQNPKLTIAAQSEYSMPVGESSEAYLRGLFTYRGKSLGDPTNTLDSVKAYGLLNLYAGIRDQDGGWEIAAYAKNVTNTFRVLTRNASVQSTGTLTHGALTGTNFYGITVTEPREFGITAKIAFGSR